ncbi:hypothetical protein HDU89_000552 [Geranomyces variabilis]|nr:hypothetical protein HDU89_000552 [Geranomyces variabilis]
MASEEPPAIRRRSIVPAAPTGVTSDSSPAPPVAGYHTRGGSETSSAGDYASSDPLVRHDHRDSAESVAENSAATLPRGIKWEDQMPPSVVAAPQMEEVNPPTTTHPRLPSLLISRPLHQHMSTADLPHRVGSRRDMHVREESSSDAEDPAAAAAARRASVRFAHPSHPSAIAEEPGPIQECSCPNCPGHNQPRLSATDSPDHYQPISRQISINGSLFSFQPYSPPHRQASTFTNHSLFTSSVNPARPPTFGRDVERMTSLTENVLDLHDEIYEDDDSDTTRNNLLLSPGGLAPAKRRWKSTATMFTGTTKTQRVITRDFLLGLTRAFARYGAPSHRIEYMMELVALALEQPASFVVIPGVIWISFGDEDHASTTHLMKVSLSWHMYKLSLVNFLCKEVIAGMDVASAVKRLADIATERSYPRWLEWLTYPMTTFLICILGFGGGWVDAATAGVLGALVGLLSIFSNKISQFTHLIPFLSAFFVSVMSRSLMVLLVTHFGRDVCYHHVPVVLSSIVSLMPGLSITIALIELHTKNLVSGTVRLFYALFHATLLGFGISAGAALVSWGPADLATLDPTCKKPSWMWNFLLYPFLCTCFIVSFQAHRPQWLHVSMVATLGWIAYLTLSLAVQFQTTAGQIVPNALAAFIIGVAANIYARITKDVAVPAIIVGITQLVPGSMGVRATLGFFGQNSTNAMQVVFEMLMIGMSIGIGLFLASLVVFPIKGPRYKYMTI